jgi:hypothetical protein
VKDQYKRILAVSVLSFCIGTNTPPLNEYNGPDRSVSHTLVQAYPNDLQIFENLINEAVRGNGYLTIQKNEATCDIEERNIINCNVDFGNDVAGFYRNGKFYSKDSIPTIKLPFGLIASTKNINATIAYFWRPESDLRRNVSVYLILKGVQTKIYNVNLPINLAINLGSPIYKTKENNF